MSSTSAQRVPLAAATMLLAACLSTPAARAPAGGDDVTPPTPPSAQTAAPAPAPTPPPPPAPSPAPAGAAPRATIAEIAAAPDRFVGTRRTIAGHLVNESASYFSRPRLVLQDGKNGRLAVRPWLRSSVAPGRERSGSSGAPPPETQGQYLNKDVELTGTLQPDDSSPSSRALILIVSSARIVERPG